MNRSILVIDTLNRELQPYCTVRLAFMLAIINYY